MSRRSTERRQARREKDRNRWPKNENALSGAIRQGVDCAGALDYSLNRRGGLAGPTAQSPDR